RFVEQMSEFEKRTGSGDTIIAGAVHAFSAIENRLSSIGSRYETLSTGIWSTWKTAIRNRFTFRGGFSRTDLWSGSIPMGPLRTVARILSNILASPIQIY